MSSLSREEKEIILDFYFRCGTEDQINRARDLIANNPEAAKVYVDLEATLTELDGLKYEPCPDNLAELTVAKLKLAVSASHAQLESLLATEQGKSEKQSRNIKIKNRFWRFAEIATAAAMILIALSMLFPTTSKMRQIERRNTCAAQLGNVGRGIAAYAADHNGALPSVGLKAGSPWWKVGDQGTENQSNTRHLWLLVKDGYADGKNFVCPGRKNAKVIELNADQLKQYNDFPSRQNVNYSFALLISGKMAKRQRTNRITVLMADQNPVFEKVFNEETTALQRRNEFTKILMDNQMRRMMSTNHKGLGQNILFRGGGADFRKKRVYLNDDIYTIRNMDAYSGREVPYDEKDIFLVP